MQPLKLSALALALIPVAAHATDDPGGRTTVDEVVVTGGLERTLPQEISKYGAELSVISGATLARQGYPDISQALQMETPGLHLAPRNGPFSYVDISIEGSRTGDVLWTVDGVRINNRLYTSTTPADTLPANMVERIEVLKGGQGLFYGAQAAAGVINVVTREFSDEFDGRAAIGADTFGGVRANGYVRGAAGGHQVVAFASKDKSDGYRTFSAYQPSATARKRAYDVLSVGGKYAYQFTDALIFSAFYQHTDADLEYPGAILTAEGSNNRNEDIFSAKFDYTPSDKAQLFLKGYYHDWDTHYTTVNNVPGQPGRTEVVDQDTFWGFNDYGVNFLAKLQLHRGFEYLVGYDFQTYSGRDDVLLIRKQRESVHAGILQVRTTDDLIPDLHLAAGARYNHTGQADDTIWNVGGRYDISPAFFLEGTAGSSFILPSAEQLFGIDPCCSAGNPDLKPERSRNLNLAVGGDNVGGLAAWRISGFARRIDHLILEDFGQPAFPDGIYDNLPGQVRMSGAEAWGSVDIADGLRLTGSYTYTRARERGSKLQVVRIPKAYAKAALAYEPADHPFGGSVTALWTGDNYSSVTGFGRLNYGNYVVVDVAAFVYLDPQARHHRLGARLENAFDEDYATRVNSAVRDDASGRFLFANRGVPRALHVSYTYAFN